MSETRTTIQTPFVIRLLKGAFSFLLFISASQVISLFVVLCMPFERRWRKNFHKKQLRWLAQFVVATHFNIRAKILNPGNENFNTPAVIIGNHQSVLDVPLSMMLTPNLIVITNDWPYKNPFRFLINRYFDFVSVAGGIESNLEKIEAHVKKGNSILIFPEGSRKEAGKVGRFHQGAFLIAEKLGLEILPVIMKADTSIMKKSFFYLKSGTIKLKILPRIKMSDGAIPGGTKEKAKFTGKIFRNEFERL